MSRSRKTVTVPEKYTLMINFIISKAEGYFRESFMIYFKKSQDSILLEYNQMSKVYNMRISPLTDELIEHINIALMEEFDQSLLGYSSFWQVDKKEMIRFKKIITKVGNFFKDKEYLDRTKYNAFARKNHRELYRLFRRKITRIHRKDIVISIIDGDVNSDRSFEEMLQAAERVIALRK